ncbi:MAG: CPBP family intramembrane metalloprotease [Chloroflexales bacterium]|nr:CPBP family intramembrane metalloprotease [Chloroflexales bacterium]
MFTQLTDGTKAALFYVLAFGLTLCVSLLAPLLGAATMFLHMYTPTVATLLMLLVVTRDGYTRAGWAGLGLHRAGLRYWLLALLGPLALMSVVYAIVWNSGVARAALPADFTLPAMLIGLGTGLMISSGFALGEEIGFRGYLLPLLMPLGPTRALLLSGLLHALWHFPLMLLTSFYPIRGSWLIVGPLILLTLTTAGVFYGFLQLKSRSVWPATLAHGAINTYFNWFALFTVTSAPLALEYLAGETGVLTLIATAGAAGYLLYRLDRQRGAAQQQAPRVEAQI